jgi:MFS family permease
MFSAGAVIGVAIGGTVINNFGWHATFLLVIPIAVGLFLAIIRFIHLDVDKVTQISDKNTEFCFRFIHVRKDILLSESSGTLLGYDSSSSSSSTRGSIDKTKSSIDVMGAITLSITSDIISCCTTIHTNT